MNNTSDGSASSAIASAGAGGDAAVVGGAPATENSEVDVSYDDPEYVELDASGLKKQEVEERVQRVSTSTTKPKPAGDES